MYIVHKGGSKCILFITRQAQLPPKVPRQHIFADPCKNSQLMMCKFFCFSKYYFTVPLKNALFLNYYTSKILVLTFLQICQKSPKNDGQIKKLSNFCKKLHHKINFSQHFMFPQVKTQLSLSQNNFLVIGTHWTVA